jgi:GT2 family glycosyltransferase
VEVKKGMIAATVVTRNRLELLKQVITGLRTQTHKLDCIIIVNNASDDGTAEWLASQTDLLVFTQENVGGAGGHCRGSQEAYNAGYEWIWQMDDDVVPTPNCLEELLKYATEDFVPTPLRIAVDGNVFYKHDTLEVNLTNPFKSIWRKVFTEADMADVIYADGVTLEGPLFHRSMYDKVGFVVSDFFIYADDTEFCIRLMKAGIRKGIIRNAVLQRLLPIPADEHIFDWKTYYTIHNLITIDRLHCNWLVRTLRPLGYCIKWLCRCKSLKDVCVVLRAFK